MDVLNEFELKYFETKELVVSLRSKLNEFVEETVDEKVMDERAKKKVDEIWEKNKSSKREGSSGSTDLQEEAEQPDPAQTAGLFELDRGLEAQLAETTAQTDRLFAGTALASSSLLERPKPEPRLTAKPKKRSVDSTHAAQTAQAHRRGRRGLCPVQPADPRAPRRARERGRAGAVLF